MQLKFDLSGKKKRKRDIPERWILCRGVESRTVTGVYFCHIHQQDVSHTAKNKQKANLPTLPAQDVILQ